MGLTGKVKRSLLAALLGVMLCSFNPVRAQEDDYLRVVTGRAEKIVSRLNLNDPEKETRVRDIIAKQYYHLHDIHEARDARIAEVMGKDGLDDASRERQKEKIKAGVDKEVKKLHGRFLGELAGELNPRQVDLVKDGMTYGLVEHTYQAYLSLLPDLTEKQKEKILAWLVEAREIAMDGGSSEEKHYWFGKYKGKINNYLSAEGYDLKKAEEQK